jgi:hypothetical protein
VAAWPSISHTTFITTPQITRHSCVTTINQCLLIPIGLSLSLFSTQPPAQHLRSQVPKCLCRPRILCFSPKSSHVIDALRSSNEVSSGFQVPRIPRRKPIISETFDHGSRHHAKTRHVICVLETWIVISPPCKKASYLAETEEVASQTRCLPVRSVFVRFA